MKIYTKSKDNLYEASGLYDKDRITVLKGSRINLRNSKGFNPPPRIKEARNDRSIVNENGILLQDVIFRTLSTAATFVTGRSANGMIVWKTENGKYIRYALNKGDDNG